MRLEQGEKVALEAAAHMQRGRGVPLGAARARAAAEVSLIHKLSPAEAIVLTTARTHSATRGPRTRI